MDIAPLPIKLVRQDADSDDCLRCCTLMVLQYFDKVITKEEVWRKLHVYKKHSGLHGGYLTDLGKMALARNYKVSIHHGNWRWWDKATVEAAKKSKATLLKALKQLRQAKKTWGEKKEVSKEINFVNRGGQFHFEIPKLETINGYLYQGCPVILLVCAQELYQNPKEHYIHALVVTGRKGNHYFLKDPYLAIEEISAENLFYAWARASGWLLTIQPLSKPQPQLGLFEDKATPPTRE